MKTAFFLFLVWSGMASAAPIEDAYLQRIGDAIYRAEGGARARQPYGILTVKIRDEVEARAVCLTTIRRSWDRWQKTGAKGDFIEHLGASYCPTKGDKTGLNRHWITNVRFFLNRPRKRNFSIL